MLSTGFLTPKKAFQCMFVKDSISLCKKCCISYDHFKCVWRFYISVNVHVQTLKIKNLRLEGLKKVLILKS